jgi:hypothetical protein
MCSARPGRTVVNDIQARFVFRDGKICEHHDHFDLWRWSRQALGTQGPLLGWTPLVQNAIRAQAKKGSRPFRAAAESERQRKPWFVYLVRAANGSLYCGISDDPVRRFAKHQTGKGARFFASSPAVALVYVESWPDKGEACVRSG